MIGEDGWQRYNIWQHSETVRELYELRAQDKAEEMTCHAQAAELLAARVSPGDVVLDVGCGSGYFWHALRKRNIDVEYHGIDATPDLVVTGWRHLPAFGLPVDRLRVLRIEDLHATVDHVVCINVLSNIDNFHKPLERMLRAARKSVILRESCHEPSEYRYVRDDYLDPGVDLKVHVNTYSTSALAAFIESHDFDVDVVRDERSGDEPEMVIGYPHYWKFMVCDSRSATNRSATQ